MRLCLRCYADFAGSGWRCPQCGFDPPRIGGFPAFAPELAQGASGYDPAHFAELARLEAGNFWFRARNRLLAWVLQRYFPGARSFLEIGCGTGFVLAGIATAFPALKLSASEAAVTGLAHAAARVPGASLMQMDARRIPFTSEFDVIGAFDVLEHIDDDQAVLAELFRVVRPGGGIIVSVPQHPWLWSGPDVAAHHRRRYRVGELDRKVAAAGFAIMRSTSFVGLLLPMMILSRLRPSARSPQPVELAPSRWLNTIFETILDWEVAAISAGISLPFGGSRIVVAGK